MSTPTVQPSSRPRRARPYACTPKPSPARRRRAPILGIGQDSGPGLDARPLSTAILAAALLSLEQAGARFEPGKRKALFGLVKTPALFIQPGSFDAAWPEHSWEAKLADAVRRLAPKGKNDVMEVVYTALGRTKTDHPDVLVVRGAEASLRERGWTQTTKAERTLLQRLRAATEIHTLTDAGQAALQARSADAVREMLSRAEQERPEIWALLRQGIQRAYEWAIPSGSD